MKKQKQFFIISFLPAIAYWYLEENYSLQIALIGGGLLACTEIVLEKVFTKHVHSISKFNFYLIVVLGSIAFIGDEGIWFKLQPFFTGIFMGGYLLFRIFRNNSLMVETIEAMGQVVPFKNEFKQIEKHMGIFLICYGIFMAYVAFELTTSQWTFFKTVGFYIVSLIFFIAEFIHLKVRVKKRVA
jgi:intracellular septation protein